MSESIRNTMATATIALALVAASAVGVRPAVAASSAGGVGRPAASTSSPDAAARQAAIRALRGLKIGAPGRPARVAAGRRAGAPTLVYYYNWAGYADDNSSGNTYSSASGSWVQPTITCANNEYQIAVFWVGLDGFSNGTVEQEGTYAACFQGQPYYYTWWEMYPTNDIQLVGTTVAPGDAITASTRYGRGTYTLTVTDATTPANSFTTQQSCASGLTCARASAEWIAESPSGSRGYFPVPDFATWHLTSAHVTSGTTKGVISSFPDDQIIMLGSGGYNLVDTSRLSRSGNSFTCTWENSY